MEQNKNKPKTKIKTKTPLKRVQKGGDMTQLILYCQRIKQEKEKKQRGKNEKTKKII